MKQSVRDKKILKKHNKRENTIAQYRKRMMDENISSIFWRMWSLNEKP